MQSIIVTQLHSWLGKISWLLVQKCTFFGNLHVTYPSIFTLGDTMDTNQVTHWFCQQSEKLFFHLLGTRHVQLLIRNPPFLKKEI